MFPDAEVTSIKLDNVDDAAKPLGTRYHLDAPRYAQVTGKRILFQPSAFRRGQASPFTASERHFPIAFPFAWKEWMTCTSACPKDTRRTTPTVREV